MWLLANGTVREDIKYHMISRLEHVGEAAVHIKSYKKVDRNLSVYY